MHIRTYLTFAYLPIWVTLSILFAVAGTAQAEPNDLFEDGQTRNLKAYYVLRPAEENQYNKLTHFVSSPLKAGVLEDPKKLEKLYNIGEFLLVKVLSPGPEQHGWVTLLSHKIFDNQEAYQRQVDRGKRYRSGVYKFCYTHAGGNNKGKVSCLYDYDNLNDSNLEAESSNTYSHRVSKYIPIEAGQVRKILPVNDILVFTTTKGQLVSLTLAGNFDRPKMDLYLAKTPRRIKGDLLAQDLRRVHLGRGMYEVVTGITGSLGGHELGTKLNLFNGNRGTQKGALVDHRVLQARWDNPLFDQPVIDSKARYRRYHDAILVRLNPIRSTWLAPNFLGLNDRVEKAYDLDELKEVSP